MSCLAKKLIPHDEELADETASPSRAASIVDTATMTCKLSLAIHTPGHPSVSVGFAVSKHQLHAFQKPQSAVSHSSFPTMKSIAHHKEPAGEETPDENRAAHDVKAAGARKLNSTRDKPGDPSVRICCTWT